MKIFLLLFITHCLVSLTALLLTMKTETSHYKPSMDELVESAGDAHRQGTATTEGFVLEARETKMTYNSMALCYAIGGLIGLGVGLVLRFCQ